MPKPRTNHAACAYWADGILTDEPQPHIDVNSVQVRGDIVYSFGSHFPMGIIVRNAQGRCTRVLLNSDYWPGPTGFANTGGDQSSCRMEANDRAQQARWKVEVVSVQLTGEGRKMLRVRPREDDPEPEQYWRTEVPTYYVAPDPGPEPVKDPHGCIAGRVEEYEASDDRLSLREGPVDNDLRFTLPYGDRDPNEWVYVREASNHRTVWGEKVEWQHYTGRRPTNETYVQCPHCEAFDRIHARWRVEYEGQPYGRNSGRGYRLYREMMDRFGSEEAWRQGRRDDWARVRAGREAYRAWYDRNHIPFSAVSWAIRPNGGCSYPIYDREGYPTRKDEAAYFKSLRDAERAERRRERERLERAKYERQLERFKCGVRRRRKPGFEAMAAEVAATLSHMNANLKVTVSINDSSEEGA